LQVLAAIGIKRKLRFGATPKPARGTRARYPIHAIRKQDAIRKNNRELAIICSFPSRDPPHSQSHLRHFDWDVRRTRHAAHR